MSAHLSGANEKPLLTWREIEGICSQAHDGFTDTMRAGGWPAACDYDDQSALNKMAKQVFVSRVAVELGYSVEPVPDNIPQLGRPLPAENAA